MLRIRGNVPSLTRMLLFHSCIPSNRGQLLCPTSSVIQPRSSLPLCQMGVDAPTSWSTMNEKSLWIPMFAGGRANSSMKNLGEGIRRTVPEAFNTAAWAWSCSMSLKLWEHMSSIWSPGCSRPSLWAAPSGNTSTMNTPFWNRETQVDYLAIFIHSNNSPI